MCKRAFCSIVFFPKNGANKFHTLGNGLIGVLGHIACMRDDGSKHYYPMAFSFDPSTFEISKIKIIAVRSCFPKAGPAKESSLEDVAFSGGLIRRQTGLADLIVGVGDVESHTITIPDPFC